MRNSERKEDVKRKRIMKVTAKYPLLLTEQQKLLPCAKKKNRLSKIHLEKSQERLYLAAMTDRKKRLAQRITLGALLVLGGSAFFVAPKEALAKEESGRDIFIRQVQIAGATADEDFAVIRNDEDCALDLSGWKLRKRTSSGTESSVRVFDGTATILPPHETLLWANSKNDFAKSLDAHEESSATLTSNNSLALFDADDILVDSLSWGIVAKPFQSDEPNTTNPKANESIIRTSKTGTATLEKTDLPKGKTFDTASLDFCGASKDRASDSSVVLSEILANPSEDESEGEFIELQNTSKKSVDLSGWKLRDASKTGAYTFPEESLIDRDAFLVLSRKEFGFTINNTNETVTLEDPKGSVADTVHWDSSRENISLAFDGARWRSTKFITPGKANRFGNDPTATTRFPKKGFANIPLDFSATVHDTDGDATSLAWDFGDGHKSYAKNASHAYKKKGAYHATLRYSDGISDIERTFTVKIERYQAPKVRITSL